MTVRSFAAALAAGLGLIGAGIGWFAYDLDADLLGAEAFAIQVVLVLGGLAIVAQNVALFVQQRRGARKR